MLWGLDWKSRLVWSLISCYFIKFKINAFPREWFNDWNCLWRCPELLSHGPSFFKYVPWPLLGIYSLNVVASMISNTIFQSRVHLCINEVGFAVRAWSQQQEGVLSRYALMFLGYSQQVGRLPTWRCQPDDTRSKCLKIWSLLDTNVTFHGKGLLRQNLAVYRSNKSKAHDCQVKIRERPMIKLGLSLA